MPNIRTPPAHEDLLSFIQAFYSEALQDELLGPVFRETVGSSELEWQNHYQTMVSFWFMALFGKSGYRGNPLAKHTAIPDIDRQHFDRWLQIFERCAIRHWDRETATAFVSHSRVMAQSMLPAIDRARSALQSASIPQYSIPKDVT
jgi:hemoglobin